jgi:hypothetical protein
MTTTKNNIAIAGLLNTLIPKQDRDERILIDRFMRRTVSATPLSFFKYNMKKEICL